MFSKLKFVSIIKMFFTLYKQRETTKIYFIGKIELLFLYDWRYNVKVLDSAVLISHLPEVCSTYWEFINENAN